MSLGEVTLTSVSLPAAELGPESPLPAFGGLQRLPDVTSSPAVPADMRERIAYGRLANPLPYAVQNGYSRELVARHQPAIALANDGLVAYVLPGLGGRLWSLRDRNTGRDLVFANPRLQFANFALTDAWCAGGIEWNLGSTGHSATTSRPVFAARIDTHRGHLVRIWEWERTRDLVFCVDLMLDPDRSALLVFVRVRNLDPEPKPLYWWTNVAVPEHDGTRVLAPADCAWRTAYDGAIESVSLPHPDRHEIDASYPSTATAAADYFFQIPGSCRSWVAAVEPDGSALVQTSTDALRGRKFFLWGNGSGGRRWQEWLSGPGRRYLEIQAGLAATQLEHLRLAGHEEVSWAEAYVPEETDPASTHAGWPEAVAAVQAGLDAALDAAALEAWPSWWLGEVADRAPDEQLADGSGAGLAELLVRGRSPDELPGTPFARPRRDGFRHLAELVRTGRVDQDEAGAEVSIPPISARWAAPLDRVGDGWWGSLMLAVRAHAAGELERAETGYRRSASMRPTAWSARGRALLAVARGDAELATRLYRDAVGVAPWCVPLLVEAADQLLATDRAPECVELIDRAPDVVRQRGRVGLLRCRALLAIGRVQEAREMLAGDLEIADLREGETLGGLWREAYGDRPLPPRYDFRMQPC
jgi:hypothetical protein